MNRGQALLRQLVVKITPLRIIALDQLQFPRTVPFLDTFFAKDGIGHGLVKTRRTLTFVLRNPEQIHRQYSNDAANHGEQYRL
jgi:hypothetical protein